MSTAENRSKSRTRGFTYTEVTIVLAFLTLTGFLIERTMTTTGQADKMLASVRRATERGHRMTFEVMDAVAGSRKILQADGVGEGYLAALDLGTVVPVSTARLPRIDEGGRLGPDEPGDPHTGNVLLFVAEGDAARCVVDAAEQEERLIDVYRFVCVFPTDTDRRLVGLGTGMARDLAIWRSVPYPSLPQIQSIEDEAERQQAVVELYTRYGHDLAWDPSAPVGAAFYPLDAVGSVGAVPVADARIEEDPDVSPRGRLVVGDVQLARSDPEDPHRRALFTLDDPATWQPDGFEIKVAGPSGSRKVWVHLAVETPTGGGPAAVHASTLVASTRDL